jgi:esterase/lipase superfamily enzyme
MCTLVVMPHTCGNWVELGSLRSFQLQSLEDGAQNGYYFHRCAAPIPQTLLFHRGHQQDAVGFGWPRGGQTVGYRGSKNVCEQVMSSALTQNR